ncbi:glutathione S-transferase N-terminal domain-containing protein [Suttonella sp. R2A3]|uniref:glutathione S-transferase N-terminal domain-containing protein n=1 Tax=Suttonella sp. R2A3 TaxID=2908648 RepID=UPI001F48F3A6|nr:glutathione S-transferase N-terminal domain-containing protein [Suttonella sp. R2A3]UJF24567.1 glutathione S-transferase N-terminal domain-containing protein [Suttonella sp. R2A3]
MNIKRGGLALFASPKHVASHRIRLIAQAKDLEIESVEVDADNMPSDLLEINPNGRLPLLLDRDLMLYDERVISEYLDERFPHPALMPIEANLRAMIRLFCYEIEKNWYGDAHILEHGKPAAARRKKLQKQLRDNILVMSPYFKGQNYFIGNELSLLDCCVLPVLWRLQALEIELPKAAASVQQYLDFHAKQDYFQQSLSAYERGLREA